VIVSGRRGGKSIAMRKMVLAAVADGQVVHVAGPGGLWRVTPTGIGPLWEKIRQPCPDRMLLKGGAVDHPGQVSPCAPRGRRISGVTAEASDLGPPRAAAGFTAHLVTSAASLSLNVSPPRYPHPRADVGDVV
jgi:hypothetical protein